MKIVVGSKNPVKIAAVENIAKKIWPEAEVIGIDVKHDTSIQPATDEEGISGATKRAELALKETDADLGCGLEGNTAETPHGMMLSGWVIAVDKKGQKGVGSSGSVLLPERIAAEIRKGRELGPVMDEFIGEHNTKQKQGTIGILTNGLLTRTITFEHGVACALARFINPHYYK